MEKYVKNLKKNEALDVLVVVRWPVGGIRTFLRYVIESFPDNRCNFHVVTLYGEGIEDLQNDLGGRVHNWIFVKNSGYVTKSLLSASYKYLKTNQIDLVHAHGFSSAIASVMPAKFFRKPLILTSHDIINYNQFSGVYGRIRRAVLSFALVQCKIIHSVSDDAQANLLSFFPWARSRCVVIKNGINTERFRSAIPLNIKAMAGIRDDSILVGFFGRFMGQKGFRFLIDAIRIIREEFKDERFHVVCFGSGAFIREEQAEIAHQGLSDYFTFIPFTSDVSGAMKGCDLIAMPSIWEACPLQPMEALSAGVPLVGSDCIGLREVIRGTPAVMVRTSDALSLANGILKCAKIDRTLFEGFSEVAVERFNVRNTALSINSMYQRALE